MSSEDLKKKLPRRNFLKGSAMFAAGVALSAIPNVGESKAKEISQKSIDEIYSPIGSCQTFLPDTTITIGSMSNARESGELRMNVVTGEKILINKVKVG